jgi:hypothetical protein
MKNVRIVVERYGGPEELRVVEDECPEPRAAQEFLGQGGVVGKIVLVME